MGTAPTTRDEVPADVIGLSDLVVTTESSDPVVILRGVSLTVRAGELVGLVGESGSGKSTVALAIADLLPEGVVRASGSVRVNGEALDALPAKRRGALLGRKVALVLQDPSASLNPVRRIGPQMIEVLRFHFGVSRAEALRLAADRLREVGIDDPGRVLASYPDMLSGGMKQRVVIAMGLLAGPEVVIADEPTTALDVRVQASVLDLLVRLNSEKDVAILLVSHNIVAVGEYCDRVIVMYAGTIVESLAAADLMASARHPYTRALIGSVPSLETPTQAELPTIPGSPPDPGDVLAGCPFEPRCPLARARCATELPRRIALDESHTVACWAVEEELAQHPVRLEPSC
ncbi:ABC transporter ATP-binding protein [Jiangella anatolica]|uniref:Peptide ABC transporter ATP-binding protein n=1 Tax=Jiangella anatolica TaxID=2670374 RepID=A0A2W2B8H7_9ACTN|nr:ABC transporter ATP-binding protein [Jiangella anatolica]PZF82362.1 peptide ABC transporter ATP-binding protein [Jiangella anatolica]